MRKNKMLAAAILITCLLGGCGQKTDADVSTVIVEKDGHIIGIAIEDFSQPYYEETQMKQTIEKEVSDYNEAIGNEAIAIEKLGVENNIAKLILKYKSADDYRAFNNETLFVGTIEEAIANGYDMKVTLVDADNQENSVSEAELMEMKERKIIISEEPIQIRTYDNIKYHNPDADLVNSKELDTFNITELSYIIL